MGIRNTPKPNKKRTSLEKRTFCAKMLRTFNEYPRTETPVPF